jgi:putative salt-induced outer membrane protein YdiY
MNLTQLPIFPAVILTSLLATTPVSADDIFLVNGDRLSGSIISETDDTITLQHILLGELTLPRAQVAHVKAANEETKQEVSAETPQPDQGRPETGWLSDWKTKVSLGIAGAAGKSDDQKINAGIKAKYEDQTTRWSHETAYFRNEADRELSDHSLKSLLNRDWLLPGSPWFRFAGGRFDWDEFQDWDYRMAANGGVGYEFLNTDDYRVLGRAGVGANQTFGDRQELTLEGLIEVDATWRISAAQTFAFTNTLHPSLEESGEFRNLTSLDWTLDLDKESGFGLKISLTNDYDSLATDSSEKNDFKYLGSLVWEL